MSIRKGKSLHNLVEQILNDMYLGSPTMESMARSSINEALRKILQFMDRYCDLPADKTNHLKSKNGEIYETNGDVKTADDLRLAVELYIIDGNLKEANNE